MVIAIVPVAIVRPYNLPYIAMLLVTPGMYHCIALLAIYSFIITLLLSILFDNYYVLL